MNVLHPKNVSLPAMVTGLAAAILIAAACLAPQESSQAAKRPAASQPNDTKPQTPTTRKAEPSFSVATFNINYGNVNLGSIVKTIGKSGADLVCLQETNRASQNYLRRYLRRVYRYSFFHGGSRGSDGFGFMSKTPIKETKRLPAKFHYFDTWFCTVRLDGRDVRIVNLHLRPFDPRGVKSVGQAMRRMAQAEVWRMKEIAYIHSAIDAKTPVIAAGDFNAPPIMASATYLSDRGFIDSFAAVNADHMNHATWRWKYAGILWRYRIDYIFCSKTIVPCTSRIIASDASDHHLVISGFRWPEKDKPATRRFAQ